MNQTPPILNDLFDVLADATGHLPHHCNCSGTSHCVPCEVAGEAHSGLEQLRQVRAQANALVASLIHVARCAEAICSNYPDRTTCLGVEQAAIKSQVEARSWEESHRG